MLYLFISPEGEPNRIQLCQTLANPEGALCRYFYTIAGPSKLLTRHHAALSAIAGGQPEPCLLIAFDRQSNTFFPLRTGTLMGLSGHRDGQDLSMRQTAAMIKKGKLDLAVKVRLGQRVCAPNHTLFHASLKTTLNAPLPDEPGGSFLIRHHADLTAALLPGDVWRPLANALSALPAMQKSRHLVLMQSEIVAIPAARKRLMHVQGHNYDTTPRAIAAVTDHAITHIQSISPDSDFSFFAALPLIPDGTPTAIIEMDTRLPLCLTE